MIRFYKFKHLREVRSTTKIIPTSEFNTNNLNLYPFYDGNKHSDQNSPFNPNVGNFNFASPLRI